MSEHNEDLSLAGLTPNKATSIRIRDMILSVSGCFSMRDINELAGRFIEGATDRRVERQLKKLIEDGYIEKETNEHNGRVTFRRSDMVGKWGANFPHTFCASEGVSADVRENSALKIRAMTALRSLENADEDTLRVSGKVTDPGLKCLECGGNQDLHMCKRGAIHCERCILRVRVAALEKANGDAREMLAKMVDKIVGGLE